MTAYRKPEVKAVDLENDALDDLLRRVRRLRRRVALPAIIAAMGAAWLGAAGHFFGYWALLGSRPDGVYYVSVLSAVVAAALCALPIIVPAIGIYLALRARSRRAWQKDHLAKGVSAEWLEESVSRFD